MGFENKNFRDRESVGPNADHGDLKEKSLTKVAIEVHGQETPVSPTLTSSETLLDSRTLETSLGGVTRVFKKDMATFGEDTTIIFFPKDRRPPESSDAMHPQTKGREYELIPNEDFKDGTAIRRVYVEAGGYVRLKWKGEFDTDGKLKAETEFTHNERGLPVLKRVKSDGKLFEDVTYEYGSDNKVNRRNMIVYAADGSGKKEREIIERYSPDPNRDGDYICETITFFVAENRVVKETKEVLAALTGVR